MKSAVEEIAQTWDLAVLRGQGLWLYFLTGAAIAALVQSSSATMMMTLAALHGGLFDLQSAAALVIGADLGTTSTTALGSIGGHYIKRQLALAHVIFNLVVDTGAFFIVLPLLPWATGALGLTDPLYSLVAFHSAFNVLGLMVFIPLLRPYSNWIGTRFDGHDDNQPSLLGLPTSVPDAALAATAGLLRSMRANAVVLSLHSFGFTGRDIRTPEALAGELARAEAQELSLEQRYQLIKHLESELLAFSMDLQAQPLTPEQVALINQQGAEARAIVYSSKTLKDIRHNLQSMRESVIPAAVDLYALHRDYLRNVYERYMNLSPDLSRAGSADTGAAAAASAAPPGTEAILDLLADNEAHLQTANTRVRDIASSDLITGSELSNMLNVNREIHHAIKSLLTPS
jgi:phosphate:Na+ symporter